MPANACKTMPVAVMPSFDLDRQQNLLNSLKFSQIDLRRLSCQQNHATTCRWLLTHPEYIDWLNPKKALEHCDLLWLRGRPGTGKSTIMKFACGEAMDDEEKTTLSFFFSARGENLERSAPGMLRSLLFQLLKVLPILLKVFDEPDHKASLEEVHRAILSHQNPVWKLKVLQDLLRSALAKLGQIPLIIFVDALDECAPTQVEELVVYFEAATTRILISTKVQAMARGCFAWVVPVVAILNADYQAGRRILDIKMRLAGLPAELDDLLTLTTLLTTPQNKQSVAAARYTDSGYMSVSAIEFDKSRKHGYQTATESVPAPDGQDFDDTATEYSDASSAAFSMEEDYIRALADDLFRKIASLNAKEEPHMRASMILPELLQAFALKVGHDAPTPMHLDVMTFVHKHRHEIVTAFTKISSKQDDDPEVNTTNSNCMNLQERMSLWERNDNFEGIPLEEKLEGLDPEDIDTQTEDEETYGETVLDNRLLAYREFIPSTEAYEWLLTRLLRECRLVPTEPNTIQVIRRDVMVQLVKEVLRSAEGHLHMCKLPDGTALTAYISGSKFVVEAYGIVVSIAETGEQLAWLGAALRTSPRQSGLVHCIPMISTIRTDVAECRSEGCQTSAVDYICSMAFTMVEVPQPLNTTNGQCWHDIFKNPVVVRGYPIPKRTQWSTGLEISLNIMAGLAQTQRVDRFDDKVYIKGFSTLLIPTWLNDDIICWHLVYNKDGGRISYLDGDLDQEQRIARLNPEDFRHVLGWCSEANVFAGSKLADQTPVGHSRLPKPHAGCVLANKSVSEGKIISSGPAFNLGAKDKPIRVSRSGYIPRLQWMATKFVLLWDESDKRGWLINGTSALLHVVRASLAHDKRGDFSSAFLFESLQESDKPGKANSAIHVLINRSNLDLRLYREKNGYLLLESRIESFCNILEKLIDQQAKIARDPGIKWSDKSRKYLEGWEFEDLARRRDPLHPRVATLKAAGKAWVDFTRAIQAVTLVGSGFGDIIQPAVADFCQHWAKLPTKQYYIASCLFDLSEVIKEHGNRTDGHVRLGDNLIWHTPTTMFGTCRCGRDAFGQDHCEPVQTFFPSALSGTLGPRRHIYKEKCANDGALIFGHNSHFSWVWGDIGHPQEGGLEEALLKDAIPPSRLAKVSSDSFHDSGIGSTLSEGLDSSSGASFVKSPNYPQNDTDVPESAASIDGERYILRQYTVGILCALPKELMAVRALFDRKHVSLEVPLDDSNQYALGQMAQHMVVTACLPAGEYGTNSAATVASNMVRSFPCIRFCLLVGIGGGAPSEKNDIRLGDVVVSLPSAPAARLNHRHQRPAFGSKPAFRPAGPAPSKNRRRPV
ncbi:hypothetical protein LMH87_003497 [Akanthomyces muscarius]|uniref:Nephrocystin 3-like N-terminal domain-containing protein n=1 Tax=Akanthomyces muscarius TaxID=2231603 RepID=A0A9W8Q4L1_AKAMU|nr:hypothetical protein LMH87_003497 [Akanthomyces muscarius]KAJ4144622.1 hypothetical protein LMH87_003497 [Akanthomyces muscarius]